MRGGSAPSLYLTPLSSQEDFSFPYKGFGWRGVHPERFSLKGRGVRS